MLIRQGRPDVPGKYVIVAIGGIFAYIISYTFISIYEVTAGWGLRLKYGVMIRPFDKL